MNRPTQQESTVKHIATVVLNYNGAEDLFQLLPQLQKQTHRPHSIIIVDNASSQECITIISEWLAENIPQYTHINADKLDAIDLKDIAESEPRTYYIQSILNAGYSAGNNLGIRFAERLGASAALIANPDMRLNDENYVRNLGATLFDCDAICVAASRIVDINGRDQNPQRESTYLEELFWPYIKIKGRFFKQPFVPKQLDTKPSQVEKVSGCCLMLKINHPAAKGIFDEEIFLYCEEAVMAAKVRDANAQIVYDPRIAATHAHNTSTKPLKSAQASLIFIESRKYYLAKYSHYSGARLILLYASYFLMKLYFRTKILLSKT